MCERLQTQAAPNTQDDKERNDGQDLGLHLADWRASSGASPSAKYPRTYAVGCVFLSWLRAFAPKPEDRPSGVPTNPCSGGTGAPTWGASQDRQI